MCVLTLITYVTSVNKWRELLKLSEILNFVAKY